MTEAEKRARRIELARRLLDAVSSQAWREVVVPYLTTERDLQIALIATQTDPVQIMRYAGSVQALNSVLNLDAQAKETIAGDGAQELRQFAPEGPRRV